MSLIGANTENNLSDTEEMEDEDEEHDTEEVFFVPHPFRQTVNRIEDTPEIEEISEEALTPPEESHEDDDDDEQEGINHQVNDENESISDTDEDYVDDSPLSDESDSRSSSSVELIEPQGPPSLHRQRIYLLPNNQISNENDDDSLPSDQNNARLSSVEGTEPLADGSEDGSYSPEEGRLPHINDVSMIDEDSNVNILSNLEMPTHSERPTTQPAPSTSFHQKGSFKKSSEPGTGESEEEAQACPICFEAWESAGEHRIVSLKCGHLFGKRCIERWLKGQGGKCPQCNAKATKRDLRIIYARNLKVEDTTERVRLSLENEKLKKQMALFENEKAQLKLKNSLDSQLIKKLQHQLLMLKESVSASRGWNQSVAGERTSLLMKYKLVKSKAFDLANKNGTCRVIAFNEWMNMIVVSMQSQLDLFPGFGIKKINTLTLRVENYIPLHTKQIRDLQFSPNKRDLLLSVGVDKVAKITNIASNNTVVSYTTKFPLWCCCWNSSKSGEFFAGTSAGSVYHFDSNENTDEQIAIYQISGSGPIVSLSYVPFDHSKDFHLAGLIVTRLTSISFLELLNVGIKEHNLPLEGSFSHTAFDPVSRHFLATCRPTDKNPHTRHILCELKVINVSEDPATISNVVSVHQIFSFQGSTTMKVLSRTSLSTSDLSEHQNENGHPVLIFSEESTNSVKLYDASTASQIQMIKTNFHVIDILPVQGQDGKYVAMLSEKLLSLYKWMEQHSVMQ